MATIQEAQLAYATSTYEHYKTLIPAPTKEGKTDEEYAAALKTHNDTLAAIKASCDKQAELLFTVLATLEMKVTVDTITEIANTVKQDLSLTGSATGKVSQAAPVTANVSVSTDVELPVSGRTESSTRMTGGYDLLTTEIGPEGEVLVTKAAGTVSAAGALSNGKAAVDTTLQEGAASVAGKVDTTAEFTVLKLSGKAIF